MIEVSGGTSSRSRSLRMRRPITYTAPAPGSDRADGRPQDEPAKRSKPPTRALRGEPPDASLLGRLAIEHRRNGVDHGRDPH